jgi:hypothetical protein
MEGMLGPFSNGAGFEKLLLDSWNIITKDVLNDVVKRPTGARCGKDERSLTPVRRSSAWKCCMASRDLQVIVDSPLSISMIS